MSPILRIQSDDPILDRLSFVTYRYRPRPVRQAAQFLPRPDQPQTITLTQPNGLKLTAERGDYLVNALGSMHHRWPVRKDIFEQSYRAIRPGYYVKHATVELLPLTQLTEENPDQRITIVSIEGEETVRAGDYYLARGVNKELWVVTRKSIGKTIVPENSIWGRIVCAWDRLINQFSIR